MDTPASTLDPWVTANHHATSVFYRSSWWSNVRRGTPMILYDVSYKCRHSWTSSYILCIHTVCIHSVHTFCAYKHTAYIHTFCAYIHIYTVYICKYIQCTYVQCTCILCVTVLRYLCCVRLDNLVMQHCNAHRVCLYVLTFWHTPYILETN